MRLKVFLILVVSFSLIAGAAFAVKKYREGAANQTYDYGDFNAYASNPNAGGANGGGSGGGGCACCNKRGGAGGDRITGAKETAYKYYVGKYGDPNVSIEIKDFGCHMEAYISKEDRIIKRLSLNGGNIYEIG